MAESSNARQPRPGYKEVALREELLDAMAEGGTELLVDTLLSRAFENDVTDIHFDPNLHDVRIRLRIDGMLHDILTLSGDDAAHVVSRIKILGNMNIAEHRHPQDGHVSRALLQHDRDVRIAACPTIHGERLVLRLMPDDSQTDSLEELGLLDHQVQQLRRYVHAQFGMLLGVGPVGCGKTTTMYTCLHLLNEPHASLVTIEDPVERRVDGMNQIQVDTRIQFGFVPALRSVLRQDPNILFVGEIRDSETAHIACRAGLTGVTVLSTLHATSSAATIDVFRDFGVSPLFIADSLQGVVSQRLVRTVCDNCRETCHPDADEAAYLGVDPAGTELARGRGCDKCYHTGYHGRTGIFEILGVHGDIREAVLQGKSQQEIMAIACSQGMTTLEESAREKARAGITTVEEARRVTTPVPM